MTTPKPTDFVLARVDKARLLLAECKDAPEAKKVADMAHAALIYAKRQKLSDETIGYARTIKIDAQTLLGKFLKEAEKNKGGGDGSNQYKRATGSKKQPVANTLKTLGIDKGDSSDAQFLAEISENDPELHGEVRSGDKTVKEARSKSRRTARRKNRLAASEGRPHDSRIIIGDFREHADKVADGSVSLIFTDPPYDRKAEKLFPDLAEFAQRKLAKGGTILFYVGHLQIEAAFKAFKGLRHWWTCCCVHAESKALMRYYGIRVGWKPMLWFVKETRDDVSNIVQDTFSGAREKGQHDWQQALSEARLWIGNLCPKDGIVCDPFLGGGTTAAAAQALGRKWIGFEIDPAAAQAASARLHDAKV